MLSSLLGEHKCGLARLEQVRLSYLDAARYTTGQLLPRTQPTQEQLVSAKEQLVCGHEQLVSGQGQLVSGQGKLVSGQGQLVSGRGQLVSG